MMLPSEPNMLLSFINLKLRDQYSSLEELCDDLDLGYDDILSQLKNSGIYYDSETNQLKIK